MLFSTIIHMNFEILLSFQDSMSMPEINLIEDMKLVNDNHLWQGISTLPRKQCPDFDIGNMAPLKVIQDQVDPAPPQSPG